MAKKFSKDQEIANCISSELSNLLSEFELGRLNKELILSYVSTILQDSKLDSRIILDVLEGFGEEGKEQALCIKVSEGW